MNKKLFNVLVFAAGAAVGSLVTWKVVTTKYERIIQEEIDSVKETWARMNDEDSDDETVCADEDESEPDEDELENESDEDEVEEFDESDMIDYSQIASRYKTSGDKADTAENDEEGEGDSDGDFPYINGPYVIEPNDFADGDHDYEPHCIVYYADGILADDWGVKLDIEETIGYDALDHFGEYTDEDVVHVRNDRLKKDYEVARDPRKYSDVVVSNPPMGAYED